jgi:Protocatechuate 3,4-dioxygenase beta subunit
VFFGVFSWFQPLILVINRTKNYNWQLRLIKRAALTTAVLLLTACCSLLTVYAQGTGGVKGKVRTTSGNGIANASVTARKNGADVKSVTADPKGNFVLDGLEPGVYNLIFDAPRYSGGVLYNVEIKKKKVGDLGDRLILTADQGAFVVVKGSVFYKEGVSLSGAKIEMEEINPDGSTRKLGSTLTNISGEFTFRRSVGAAKLRVRASFKGVTGTKDIEVDSAAIYRLAITLDISRTEK